MIRGFSGNIRDRFGDNPQAVGADDMVNNVEAVLVAFEVKAPVLGGAAIVDWWKRRGRK